MVHLLITVFTIVLTALLVVASINYYPWWYKTADAAEDVTKSSLRILEQAYDVATRANNGAPPEVLDSAIDGGFSTGFLPVLKLLPAAVPQFTWKYGSSSGMNYFCMQSTGPDVNEGAIRGIMRAKGLFSDSQVYVNSECGVHSSFVGIPRTLQKLSVTMYVAYVPGISK